MCSNLNMRIRPFLALALVALTAVLAAPASAAQRYRYPLEGAHNYGNLAVTGFLVKRANGTIHLGQDIMADCGTPLVAVHAGVVESAGYSDGYGNYVRVTHATTPAPMITTAARNTITP